MELCSEERILPHSRHFSDYPRANEMSSFGEDWGQLVLDRGAVTHGSELVDPTANSSGKLEVNSRLRANSIKSKFWSIYRMSIGGKLSWFSKAKILRQLEKFEVKTPYTNRSL